MDQQPRYHQKRCWSTQCMCKAQTNKQTLTIAVRFGHQHTCMCQSRLSKMLCMGFKSELLDVKLAIKSMLVSCLNLSCCNDVIMPCVCKQHWIP